MVLRNGLRAVGASAFAAAIMAAGSVAQAAPAPSDQDLQRTLNVLTSLDAPIPAKAAVLANGQARTPNLEKMTAKLRSSGYHVTYTVSGAAAKDDSAVAKVDIVSPHGAIPMPMTWQYIGGAWKLSDASTCQLLAMGYAPC